MHRDAECCTSRSTGDSHCRRLRNVDCQHLAARSTEAAQHGNRVDFSLDECAHTAGDTDSSEQQRDQSDDADEVGQVLDRVRRAHLGLRDRAQTNLLILHALLERLDEFVGVGAGGKLGQDGAACRAAEYHQLCLGDVFRGNEDPRPEHLGDPGGARHVLDRCYDREGAEAKLERVSNSRIK